jgi:hypothetical protein
VSKGLTLKKVSTEAQLLLIGIPVLLWTLMPVYHMFLFAISERDQATSGRLWPKNPTLQNFDIVFQQKHFYLNHFWQQLGNSVRHRRRGGCDHAVRGHLRGLRHQPAEGARRAHGDEHGAVHLLHPGGLPGRADVQDHGRVRPAEQPVGADPGHGDDRVALLHLGAQAGQRQAAAGTGRSRTHGRRQRTAAVPAGLPAADGAVAGGRGHLFAAAGLERVPLRLPAAVQRQGRHPGGGAGQLPGRRRFALGTADGHRPRLRRCRRRPSTTPSSATWSVASPPAP